MTLRHYRAFGLELASDIELSGVPTGTGGVPHQVRIRLGSPVDEEELEAGGIAAEDGKVVFSVPGVARYTVDGGHTIAIEPAAGARRADIELFLLGSACGLLLQQRGRLVLHANALATSGRALAVMGPSGAGKSTLAARLCQQGFALLSDDVCVLDLASPGEPIAIPGLARFRLWGDALDALKVSEAGLAKVRLGAEKYELPSTALADDAVPLSGLYVLAQARDKDTTRFERLTGMAAIEAIMGNSYRGEYLGMTGARDRHFRQAVALVDAVPVTRWNRRWGHDRAAAEVAALIDHFERTAHSPHEALGPASGPSP